jgi:GTP pyrophosphokinase
MEAFPKFTIDDCTYNLRIVIFDILVLVADQDKLELQTINLLQSFEETVFGFITINEGIKVHKKIVQTPLTQSIMLIALFLPKWMTIHNKNLKAILITGMDTL